MLLRSTSDICRVSKQSLKYQFSRLMQRISELLAKVHFLSTQLAERDRRIAELEARLAQNSTNSSKPPRTDGPEVKREPSRRISRGLKPGGQKGHPGSTLEMVEIPDHIIEHAPPLRCPNCGTQSATSTNWTHTRHQVFDTPPPPPLVVTEHRVLACQCEGCGMTLRGERPADVPASATAYGKRIGALAAYLSVRHYLPYQRLAELLYDVTGVRLSTGTLATMIKRTASMMTPTHQAIHEAVAKSLVVHADETVAREAGRKINIWVWCTSRLTYLVRGPGRGYDVIAREWPEGLTGSILVTDRLAAQLKTPSMLKQVCLHHLHRKCLGILALPGASSWIQQLLKVLLRIMKDGALGRRCYTPKIKSIEADLAKLLHQNDLHKSLPPAERHLQAMLHKVEPYLSTCLGHRNVPPDNDEAERDIRSAKVKLNVSNQWRTPAGTQQYCILRSVTQTAIKHGLAPWLVLSGEQTIHLT